MKVDEALALEALEAVVEKMGGDYIADHCSIYIENDQQSEYKTPGCIVGYALEWLVGPKKFQAVSPGTVVAPANSVGVELSAAAKDLWQDAQIYQDGSAFGLLGRCQPWADALAYAKKKAGERNGKAD